MCAKLCAFKTRWDFLPFSEGIGGNPTNWNSGDHPAPWMYELYPLHTPDFAPYANEIQRCLNDAIEWSANAINHIGFLDK